MKSRETIYRALRIIERIDARIEAQVLKRGSDAIPLPSIIGALQNQLARIERDLASQRTLKPRMLALIFKDLLRCLRTHETVRMLRQKGGAS